MFALKYTIETFLFCDSVDKDWMRLVFPGRKNIRKPKLDKCLSLFHVNKMGK